MSQAIDRQSERASDSPDDPGPRRRDAERAESASSRALYQFGRFGLILALLVVIVTFSLWVPDTFFVWGNFRGTLDQQAIIMMVALGAMLPLIVGEFDLSVGANAGLAALLCVGLAQNQQVTPWLAIVLAVLVATVVGLINGLVVTRLRMSSFVATLGTATILVGVGQAYTGGTDINAAPESLVSIGRATILGLPAPVVVVLVTALVLLLILQKLPTGRQLLAVGANRRAAELTGIRPDRRIVLAFASGGAIAGLGGALYGAQLGTGTQSLGATLLLPAFAGAFLGATTITPGRFNVIGTIVAVLLLAFTVSGLQQVGVQPWIQFVVQGGALLVAVALSSWAADLRLARLRDAQLEHLVPVDEQPAGRREAQSG